MGERVEQQRKGSVTSIQDEHRLAELGYKQELKRDWSLIHNFGVSFSIISVVTGITTLFSFGLLTGGPGVMATGWIVVSFFTLFVGTSMAEIVSAIPTSGGPYFWAAMLAPKKYAALFSWFTGWFNFVGQVRAFSYQHLKFASYYMASTPFCAPVYHCYHC
jgi:amino acid transporter